MVRKSVYEELDVMREVVRRMRAATLHQPNISTVVKSGIGRLDNSLYVILSMRCLWRVSEDRIHHHLEATAT